uniref:Uncharacterized protein n=1 Tax=Romanomermis culicivorax TaxID=13658 RepID=A0A915J260_ROMCU
MNILMALWDDRWKQLNKVDRKSVSTVSWAFYDFFMDIGVCLLQKNWSLNVQGGNQVDRVFIQQMKDNVSDAPNWLFEKLRLENATPLDLTQMTVDLSNILRQAFAIPRSAVPRSARALQWVPKPGTDKL